MSVPAGVRIVSVSGASVAPAGNETMRIGTVADVAATA
jgi:hypothetical protein